MNSYLYILLDIEAHQFKTLATFTSSTTGLKSLNLFCINVQTNIKMNYLTNKGILQKPPMQRKNTSRNLKASTIAEESQNSKQLQQLQRDAYSC